ncbi:TetR/AcrR family transcriptional regulator [Aquisalibacillus elongatus]|uniref:TetR family transcriptional regulator n=1 Tax=Aquisalibacillus elongatus TaxID=485577 RepID=A0A3N5C6Y1_9BACI|nr:TetR/AcrR family transcriptional regulator [Aquisalibacillus elongatus]RPF52191.1 TetR family transcriptional regulator [Aquisalibacillus elongatus]
MSQKLDRRKKYTRRVLKESLISLLSEKSISSITVKELCEKADINRSTFYTHYSDHYDLLEQIEEEIAQDLRAYLSSYQFTIEEESKLMTQKLLEYIIENKHTFQTLLNQNVDPTFEKRMMNIAQQFLMNNWMPINKGDESYNRYLSTFIVSGAINVIKDWINQDMNQSPKEMSEMISQFTNNGLSIMGENR